MLTRLSRRWLLSIATVALALTTGVDAFANYWRPADPQLILHWRPNDALALLLQQDLGSETAEFATDHSDTISVIARRALRAEPLTAPALRQLGLAEASDSRVDHAIALMDLAHHVSRHDLPTLLWSVYGSATTGDVGTLLRFADEALSTSDYAKDVLFPSLTAALSEAAVRDGLTAYVKLNRPWMAAFLEFAAANSVRAADSAALIMGAGGAPKGANYSEIDAKLLSRLAANWDFATASAYLRSRTAGVDITSDIGFGTTATTFDAAPFAWAFIDRPERGALRDELGRVQVHIAPDQSGVVAFRTLALKPGDYQISYGFTFAENSPRAVVSWEMRCAAPQDSRLIWSWRFPDHPVKGPISSAVSIPADCQGQSLTLNADANRNVSESQIVVQGLTLRKEPASVSHLQ
jgi:hypothetical protein